MQSTTLAKLQQRSIALYSEAVPLHEIYNYFIHPNLDNHQRQFEINAALSKPLIHIKSDKTLFLMHSYPLFNLLKSIDISDEKLIREVLLVEIKADLFRSALAFYELIGMVSRYYKIVDLEEIYSELRKLLTNNLCQKLLSKNDLSIVSFCHLINVPESTYYNRAKAE